MTQMQWYLFKQCLGPLAAITAALTGVAILAQSLSQLDLIVEQRQSALALIQVTLLAAPQIIALILPLGLFVAIITALSRLLTENELVVVQASGMSAWQIASPLLKLASVVALAHLAITTVVQPAAYRQMRELVFELRNEVAASIVREGSFTSPVPGLMLYARETMSGGRLEDVIIEDGRTNENLVYTARQGAVTVIDGAPALLLQDGQIHQARGSGAVDLLDFEQYVLKLGELLDPNEGYVLKPSDRFLSELFLPDPTDFYAQRNLDRFAAEGHGRVSGPLINIALALAAAAIMLRGDHRRGGYGARMLRAVGIALIIRLTALGIQSAAVDSPAFNVLQYAFPTVVALAALWLLTANPRGKRAPALAPSPA